MKKALLATLLVIAWMLPSLVSAQTYDTVVVGTGTAQDRNAAFNSYYNNSWNESRYDGSEIGRAGLIQSIGFNVAAAGTLSTADIKIYMGVASSSMFANNGSWTPEGNLTLVYSSSGESIGSATGWQRFTLQSPYAYTDTTQALVVVVSRHGTSYSSALYWSCTNVGNKSCYRQSDSQNMGYENHPGTSTGTLASNRANISLVMSDIPSDYCYPPTQVAISNVSSNSADLSWNIGGSESSYNVLIGEPGFDADTMTPAIVSSTFYTFSNLLSNHTYQYAVQSICSENSSWRQGVFTTTCAEITSSDLPYFEGFSSYGSGSGTYPTCWSKTGTATVYISSDKLYVYSYSNGNYAYLFMHPVASDVDLTELQVRFLAQKYYSSSSYQDKLIVGVTDDPEDLSTFVVVDTIPMTQTLDEYEVSLSQYSGVGKYVTFKVVSDGYMNTYLDNVYLEQLPQCPRATNPTITRVTSDEADIAWYAPIDVTPNGYTVYYSTVNHFSDTLPNEIVYDTFCTLTNLNPQTTYYAWIVSNCPAGNSVIREVGGFTTECAVHNVPYEMDFEGLASNAANGSLPQCWSWLSGQAVGSNPCPHGAFARNSSVSFSMYSNGNSTIPGMGNLVALPAFDNLNSLALTFWGYQESNNTCDVFVVGVMEGNDFVPYDTITLAFDNYTEYIVSFADYQGTGNRPALRAYRASGTMHVYLDDISVDYISDCQKPTNIVADAATMQSTQATLSWLGDANANYELIIDSVAVTDFSTASVTDFSNTNSYTVTGLNPHTTYHVYVRTNCGSTYSNWGHGTFTTNRCDDMCDISLVSNYSGFNWYYNNINLYQDGQQIGGLNYNNYSSTQTIQVCPNDPIAVIWTSTSPSYSTYISFDVLDSWMNPLYSLPTGSVIPAGDTLTTLLTDCQAPECPTPLNLRAGNIDSASTWVFWFDTVNTSWEVEYGPQGFTLGQGTTLIANADSIQITGLAALTHYDFYVKAICSDTTMVSNPSSFTTGCGIISMYPYTETFEGYSEGQVPQCWTQLANSGVNPCVSVASYVAHGGSNILSMWHNQNGQQNTIATPMFDDLTGKRLKFWARYNSAVPLFSVGVINASGDYVPMDTITPANSYAEYTYDLTSWASEGNRVAFHTTCTSATTQIVYVDDVVIDIMPDCPPLEDLHTMESLATTNSVTVAWTDSVNTAWEYIYDSVAITNPAAYTVTPAYSSPLTLSGLNPATSYHIYVRPSCPGVTPWSHTVAATKVCDNGCDVEIVMHDSYGDGWNGNKIIVSQNGIMMGEATIATGNSATARIGICPSIPIQFNYQTGSYASETSFEINDAWNHQLYSCTNGSNVQGQNFFSYTTDCQAPLCVAPDHIAAQSITSTGATLTWFDTMAVSWTIKYDVAQFDPLTTTTATTVSAQDTFYTLNGLSPMTTYWVYVQANCTDTTIWSNAFSFTTGCGEITTVPWSEDFEGMASANQNGQFGQCWNVLQSYGSNPCPYGGYANSGSASVSVYAYSGTNTFALPAFQSLAGLQFSFYGFMEANNPADLFTVGVIDANGSYVPMDTITLGNTYGYHVVVLDDYALIGNRVAISATRNSGTMHVYVDDFTIDSISNCLPVRNLSYSNATTSSVVLDWDDMSNVAPLGYEIEYGSIGFVHGQGTTVYTTSHPYTLASLPSSSNFNYYVRPICSTSDTGLWSSQGAFATECDIVTVSSTEPFFEGFESDQPSNCWNLVYANPNHPSNNDMIHTTNQAQEGSRSFRFSSYSSGAPYDQYLVTPQLSASDSLMLSFFARRSNLSDESFAIGYSESSNDPTDTTWVWGTTYTSAPQDSWAQYTDTFPATAKYIGIHYSSNYLYYLYIDSFLVTSNGGGCSAPRYLSVNHDFANATISWTGSGNEYEVAIKSASTGVWPAATTVQGNTYTFTGLTPATMYQYRVRQNCDEGAHSQWVEGSFTTDSLPCFTPTNLTATPAGTSVDLDWTIGGEETQWMVKVWNTAYADSVVVSMYTFAQSSHSYTFQNLTSGTQYYAAVAAYCGNGAHVSDWSDAVSFTTTVCTPVTNVAASNVTNSGAKIAWTSNSDAAEWEVTYGTQGFGQGEGTTVTVTAPEYTINGLYAETTYDVYVRAICGTNYISEWSEKVTFTTGNVGINEVSGLNVNIYPNPATTATTITLSGMEGEVEVSIVDMTGRKVMNEKMECAGDCVKTINVDNLAQGAYFVRIQANGTNMVKKLIVK